MWERPPLPEKNLCGFCGKVNKYRDEEGFFYLWTEEGRLDIDEGKPACEACCKGEPGKQHERLHGKGNEGR